MKTLLAITICLALLALPGVADACGPYDRCYLAKDYFMFRICGNDMEGDYLGLRIDEEEKRSENAELWAKLTSPIIPLSDIFAVVYKWDLNKVRALNDAAHTTHSSYETNNIFARWIVSHQDTEIADFLLLAKRNEKVRCESIDPWYYAVEGDDVSSELHNIINEAKSYKGKRLHDRYALQILRAMFSSYLYDDCINFWNKSKQLFNDNILRKMAAAYAAGAYYHIGDVAKAGELYLESDDLYLAYMCLNKGKEDYYLWMYKNHPNNKLLLKKLQSDIHSIERWSDRWSESDKEKYEQLYPFVKRVASEQKCTDMAPWYYAAAFVAEKLDKESEAKHFILKARNAKCNNDLMSAIQVLDFYITVRYAPRYDNGFENYVFAQLSKLDKKILSCLDDKTKDIISKRGFENHNEGISQYYWNDMMRKIVISELVPLCIKSNYKTRALQYLNMADNRIFNLVQKRFVGCMGIPCGAPNYRSSDSDYTVRYVSESRSRWDYTNDYFINLDSIGVKYVQRLEDRIRNPKSPLDRFLNQRSYTDPQYLCEIIGTQLIASMRYREAVNYLKRVSKEFNEDRNVFCYCNVDPWTGKKSNTPDAAYKLHFAERMASFEKKVKYSTDPNDKAEALLQYAWGLQSSIGEQCWPLTSYYWGCFSSYPFYSQYQRHLIKDIRTKSDNLKRQALAMFTDSERAAQAHYEWQMFRSAATKYKGTKVAEFIIGHCDNLHDYIVTPALHPKLAWEEWEKNNPY